VTPPAGGTASFNLDRVSLMASRDYGIVATPSYWYLPTALQTSKLQAAAKNVTSFTVKDGHILQGQGNGYGSDPMFFETLNGVTVDNVDSLATGMDTDNLYGMYASNVKITNSTLRSQVDWISNRMLIFASINLPFVGGTIDIENNHILGSPQAGIWVDSTKPGATLSILHNDIRQNAVATDPYGIYLNAVQNFEVAYNTIIPISGRGIMIDGFHSGSVSDNGIIHDNFVQVFEKPNLEYGADAIEATALRLRNYSTTQRNLHFYNNTFIA